MVDLKKIFSSIVGESEKRDGWNDWNDGTAPIADSTESTFTNGSDAGALADPSEQTTEEHPSIPASPDGATPPTGNPWAAAFSSSFHGETPSTAGHAEAPESTTERPRDREAEAPADGHALHTDDGLLTMTPFGAVVLPEDATPGSLVDDWYKSHEFMGPIRPEYQEGVAGTTPIPRRV